MSSSTTFQSGPATPQDAKRKRKAKDSTASKQNAKRIRTQDEDAAVNGTPTEAKAENGAVVLRTEPADSQTEVKPKEEKALGQAQGGEAAKPKKKRYDDNGRWYISEPVGGRFLPIDPVFSKDEKYDDVSRPYEHPANDYLQIHHVRNLESCRHLLGCNLTSR